MEKEVQFYPEETWIPFFLQWLGMLPNYRGRAYLQTALELMRDNKCVGQDLFRMVADEHGVKSGAVRQGISSAVKRGRERFPEHWELLDAHLPVLPMPPLDALVYRMHHWLKSARPAHTAGKTDIQWWIHIT